MRNNKEDVMLYFISSKRNFLSKIFWVCGDLKLRAKLKSLFAQNFWKFFVFPKFRQLYIDFCP